MTVQLLCLSDLHLGAKESLLSNYDKKGRVADDPGAVVATLAPALRATVAAMSPRSPVRLVLLGDVLDLGLSGMGDVSSNLLHFLGALFPSKQEADTAPFARDIIYIPGNHDHHVWRMAQDEEYVGLVERAPPEPLKRDLLQISPIADEPAFACRLVTALMKRVPALRKSVCRVAYPNWAVRNKSGTRAVVLHHGHFLDPTYMALSRLAQWLTGAAEGPGSATDIERCNGAWIDFLWSDLGSAGAIGEGADTLYNVMMDAEASHEFAGLLSKRIAAMLASNMGIRSDTPLPYNLTPASLISAAVDFTAGRTAESQRDGYRNVLSPDTIQTLLWYLANPVARQFKTECGKVPDEIAFIFGHTHKPFQDQIMAPPYRAPSRIYNTGGWVLDEPTLMPCQGAAAVLVDDDLNVASLRLFDDVTNDTIAPVRAAGIGGYSDTVNPLLAKAKAVVGDKAEGIAGDKAITEAWRKFSNAARDAILKSAQLKLGTLGDVELERRAGVAA
jgi:UDP-2,3-diacylglucosamine pyrophosphatase LpxH